MRLGEINGAISRPTGLAPRAAGPESSGQAAASRALVTLSPAAVRRDWLANHRQAAFLAHLIAVKGQHPQTCARRRAEPNEALAAYRATVELTTQR